jgi:hypothetical protein
MNTRNPRSMARPATVGMLILAIAAGLPAQAGDAARQAGPAAAAPLGAALPGGAIVSAKFAQITPAAGGPATTATIGADGSFQATGLKPGSYKLAFTSTPKQTQGTTFGEKVQSGLAQTGGALATGAARSQQAAPASPGPEGNRQIDSTPARISTNFTVGKQTGRAFVDGPAVDVEVGSDGVLAGRATPVTE